MSRYITAIRHRVARAAFVAIGILIGALAGGRAGAQQPKVFEEQLHATPNQPLSAGQVLTAGQTAWKVTIAGGNLAVESGRFSRTVKSPSLFDSAALTQETFTPFVSDSWVLRAVIRGTSTDTSSPYNQITLQVEGDTGTYGARILPNRTDGNPDVKLGTNASADNMHNQDVFPVGRLLNRDVRVTLVNRQNKLHLFIDDAQSGGVPTNVMIEPFSGPGTLGPTTWRKVHIGLGPKFTGELDEIQFYNVSPLLETFRAAPAIDPLPGVSAFNHTWTILDTNAPAQWAVVNDTPTSGTLLRWKAQSATDAPRIQTTDAASMFLADSWVLEATIVFRIPVNNLGSQRAMFELGPLSGPLIGVAVPKSNLIGPTLWAYSGTEANVVAAATGGGDLSPGVPYRLRVTYTSGELVARIHDRKCSISATALGIGALDWRTLTIRGGKDFPFSVDNILFFNTAPGYAGAGPAWAHYE